MERRESVDLKSRFFNESVGMKDYNQILADSGSIEYHWLLKEITKSKKNLNSFFKDINNKIGQYPTLLKDLAFEIILAKKRRSSAVDLLKLLARYGADLKSYTRTSSANMTEISNITLLHDAIQQGDADSAKYLIIQQKVDVSAATSEGETPLDYIESTNNGSLVLVKNLLLKYGAKSSKEQSFEIIMSKETLGFPSHPRGISFLTFILSSSAY